MRCFQSPCSVASTKEKKNGSVAASDDNLSIKYPYFVWHKSKRHLPVTTLEQIQDREEENMINLTCSDYLYEAVELIER